MNDIYLFILASLFFMGGQIIRSFRWRLLLTEQRHVRLHVFLTSQCVGSLCNVFLPFRLGEISKMLYFWKRTHCRITPMVASVIAERIFDLCWIIIIFLIFVIFVGLNFLTESFFLLSTFFIAIILFIAVISFSIKARRCIYLIASIFNETIKNKILELLWILIYYFRNKPYISAKFVLYSAVMWGLYLMAYLCIAKVVLMPLREILIINHSNPFSPASFVTHQSDFIQSGVFTSIFVMTILIPLFIAVIYGLAADKFVIFKNILKYKGNPFADSLKVPSHFNSYEDYKIFLTSFFMQHNSAILQFTNSALDNALVIRLLTGGSGALVALIQENGSLKIRKYAQGKLQNALISQIEWLKKYYGRLPLVPISDDNNQDDYCTYDMPYNKDAIDYYEFIHASPYVDSELILKDIYEQITKFHLSTRYAEADDSVLLDYYEIKIKKNFDIILNNIANIFDLKTFRINGIPYSINEWDFLKNKEQVINALDFRYMSSIHGDLTIENIIIHVKDSSWYIIDPNPNNIFNCELLDLAKLFQSLHTGYELLNKFVPCSISEDNIKMISQKSHNYANLFTALQSLIFETAGEDILRQIYFHEIVHYLRLIPYKLRQEPEKGLLFFANTCILIREYRERYDIS